MMIEPQVKRGIYLCPKCRKPLQRWDDVVPARWTCTRAPACGYTQADEHGRPAPPQEAGAAQPRGVSQRPATRSAPRGRVGERCPDCGKGLLIQKILKSSGRPFVGCNRFPQCRFFGWPGR
ncbi:topoisomerase DNA-binding C4 zinc finger domain-containing protein [Paraburkholderia sp. CNPSo 3274]|uniref:topoisomerase DNA-binding C4 zinc finger domain-containing protein n=1 Tax=Paraburkholderia sp. CNPSo 3274 TaxID=2940932 RepID=UPI0020B896A2|nr:topoisomerase DNA-binding C4 zinc finger domain-containing protein [Paraburkholderia sp. CNPSo 3274]MCP3712488.1 topoisomerase DNA-binding C4 zinc finger domain-containing protein [Paraburkholderia sp. CNPSo 3274]